MLGENLATPLPLFHPDYRQYLNSQESHPWSLAKLWCDYRSELCQVSQMQLQAGDCAEVNPRFHWWRQRQIRRCKNELGYSGAEYTHPIMAFELSQGCSIGCWFCGISAEKFHGNFPYTRDNARLWKEVLGEGVDLFGTAMQTGFCYWATDPTDNPNYPEFIEDFYFSTGSLPQTTTAAPLRDLAFTAKILRLHDQYRCGGNRFSILSLKTFDSVHATFSSDDLFGVEVVPLNSESLYTKAPAGRARDRMQKVRADAQPGAIVPTKTGQTTIACVSGFLVNMVNRRIQLISPTRSCELWPLGYRIFGERQFGTAREFRAAIEDLIAAHMPQGASSTDILSFREDLDYYRESDRFELRAATGHFGLGGFAGAGQLGDWIHAGNKTAGEILAALARDGADVFVTADALQKLFNRGLLNEDPKLGGIGSRTAPMTTMA